MLGAISQLFIDGGSTLSLEVMEEDSLATIAHGGFIALINFAGSIHMSMKERKTEKPVVVRQ